MKLPSWIPGMKPVAQWFLSAVIGGAVVALVNQHFAVQLEQNKTLIELRQQAYVNFFNGQAALRRGDDKVYREKVTDARFVIGVYGTGPTVEALATYYTKHFNFAECPGSKEKWIDDVRIYHRMRDELFGGGMLQTILPFMFRNHDVDDATLALVIHDCKMPPK